MLLASSGENSEQTIAQRELKTAHREHNTCALYKALQESWQYRGKC